MSTLVTQVQAMSTFGKEAHVMFTLPKQHNNSYSWNVKWLF